MRKVRSRIGVLLGLAFVGILLTALTLPTAAAPPLPGAIFTTVHDGTRVNANIYQAKCDLLGVWLDGGPGPNAPAGAAGLPEGDYFFQVTDPSGKTLLSTDAVKFRQFHVGASGFITGVSGDGNHTTDTDTDHAGDGAKTIELCTPTTPFLDTPNPGGVYKVWVTPVGDYVGNINNVDNPCSQGCFHGFIPAASKVDNFKVRGQPGPCIIALKYIDSNGNGHHDVGEVLTIWPITIFDPLGAQINGQLFTNRNKDCTVFNLVPGRYTVIEEATDGTGTFVVTENRINETTLSNPDLDIVVRIRSSDVKVVFGNAPVN